MHAADYIVIERKVEVNRPATEVWKRVGDYCAIAEWLKVKCDYASGSGEIGSVRRINGTNLEPMVAKTEFSYTYWQTTGNMAPMGYHGTLAVEQDGADRSKLIYTLFYDQAAMASRAILQATLNVASEGYETIPEIMMPLIACVEEMSWFRQKIDATAAVFEASGRSILNRIGTIIELPHAPFGGYRRGISY